MLPNLDSDLAHRSEFEVLAHSSGIITADCKCIFYGAISPRNAIRDTDSILNINPYVFVWNSGRAPLSFQ